MNNMSTTSSALEAKLTVGDHSLVAVGQTQKGIKNCWDGSWACVE
jgi:hypothetical protein